MLGQRRDNAADIVAYLIANDGFKLSQKGDRLQSGKCPECGKKEAWTKVEKPHYIYCSRMSKCGANVSVKDLYPHLYQSVTQEFEPKLNENPNAIADAYLSYERGFDITKIKGWYNQARYFNPTADKKPYSVKFQISDTCYYERFIEPVTITSETGTKRTRKNRIVGSYTGTVWQPPSLDIKDSMTLYVTEAIFKSIALHQHGMNSVSCLSASHIPEQFYKQHQGKKIAWVIALDNDTAGQTATHKHIKLLQKLGESVTAILPPKGTDWDDLHRLNKLEPENFKEYRYYGDLLTAESKETKANIINAHTGRNYFNFEFRNRTYNAEFPQKDSDKSTAIKSIADFTIEFLYYQQPDIGDDGEYFFKINFANRSPTQTIAIPGKVLSSATDFKKTIQQKAPGGLFTGNSTHLDMLYREWFYQGHKTVTTIDYIGYNIEQKAYIYPQIAIQKGNIIPLNQHKYFPLTQGGIKTTSNIRLDIDADTPPDYQWLTDFKTAYGIKGMTCLIWWLGTLFAQQIRDQHGSYPFLELYGEGSSGKTSLIEFMWKLLGRDGEEGFDISKSTAAGRYRRLSQLSNMPVVLAEADEEDSAHARKFDWKELKVLFNGRLGRVVGEKQRGNATYEPPFRGAVMMAHNTPIQSDKATLSRLIQVHFDLSHHSPAGKLADERLAKYRANDLSNLMLDLIKHEKTILQTFADYIPRAEATISASEKIQLPRITKNHAAIAALSVALKTVLPITAQDLKDIYAYTITIAEKRQQSLNDDHPTVQLFWQNYQFIDNKPDQYGHIESNQINHATTPDTEIWINLSHYRQQCVQHGLEVIADKDLRQLLPSSQNPKYIGNSSQRSKIQGRTMRVWQFKRT